MPTCSRCALNKAKIENELLLTLQLPNHCNIAWTKKLYHYYIHWRRKMFYSEGAKHVFSWVSYNLLKFDIRSHYAVQSTTSMQSMLKLGGSGGMPPSWKLYSCMEIVSGGILYTRKIKLLPIFFLILGKVDSYLFNLRGRILFIISPAMTLHFPKNIFVYYLKHLQAILVAYSALHGCYHFWGWHWRLLRFCSIEEFSTLTMA